MKVAIVLQKDPDSDYGVVVPDVPGCFSAGETVEEAKTNALEAITGHIELWREDEPNLRIHLKPLKVHQDNPEFAGDTVLEIDVDLPDVFVEEAS